MLRRFISVSLILTLLCGSVLAEDETSALTDAPASASETREQTVLQRGDKDGEDETAVVLLQNRLIELGFLNDDADGTYGENTETAVDQFQKLNGLERTGIADVETQELLFSDVSALTTPSPDNQIAYGRVEVRVQSKLVLWGFLAGKVDGKLGKSSRAAIKRFKEYIETFDPTTPAPSTTPNLKDGDLPVVQDCPKVTPAPTPFVIDDEINDKLLAYIDGDRPFDPYVQTVQINDKNDEVARVQRRLRNLKYLYTEADGEFGINTARALIYFQYKNGLDETGIADEATQRKLFSEDVVKSDEYVNAYKIFVDISDQRVYIFRWNGRDYSELDHVCICSTGTVQNPTPLGTYQAYGRCSGENHGEWYWFDQYQCYAKWAFGIVGGVLFHSITFNKNKQPKMSEKNLGKRASHGCVRLTVDDAKWIYDNCIEGTTVVIQE